MAYYSKAKASIHRTSNKLMSEYAIFFSNRGRERNKIGTKMALGNEDDVRTSNTRIAQRKRVIPHSTMKNMTSETIGDEK